MVTSPAACCADDCLSCHIRGRLMLFSDTSCADACSGASFVDAQSVDPGARAGT